MAVYKPTPLGGGDPPRVNQRIDGMIYTYNRQTNTINSWHYPKKDQSFRFEYINGQILRLDQMYQGLTTGQKTAWENFFAMSFWQLVCWIFNEDEVPVEPDDTGLASYRAVNINRIISGLSIISSTPTDPPAFTTGSVVFTTVPTHVKFNHTGTGSPFGYMFSIYGRPCNTEPSPGEQVDKALQYIATFQGAANVDYDISSYLASTSIFGNAPYRQVEVRVGTWGSVPRLRGRTSG